MFIVKCSSFQKKAKKKTHIYQERKKRRERVSMWSKQNSTKANRPPTLRISQFVICTMFIRVNIWTQQQNIKHKAHFKSPSKQSVTVRSRPVLLSHQSNPWNMSDGWTLCGKLRHLSIHSQFPSLRPFFYLGIPEKRPEKDGYYEDISRYASFIGMVKEALLRSLLLQLVKDLKRNSVLWDNRFSLQSNQIFFISDSECEIHLISCFMFAGRPTNLRCCRRPGGEGCPGMSKKKKRK